MMRKQHDKEIGEIQTMSWGKIITLKSSDGEIFKVEDVVVRKSELITHIIEDDGADKEISLPHVTSKILSTVIVYCRKHVETPMSDDELRTWDAEFVKVDQATLSDLVLAANYLCIKSLLDLTCQAVADMIIGENS